MKQVKGDLLSLTKGILVHGCNCQGQMGAGIALPIRNKWKPVYYAYVARHAKAGLRTGDTVIVGHTSMLLNEAAKPHLDAHCDVLPPDLIVVNAMTQETFGSDRSRVYVDYDGLEAAFVKVGALARDTGLTVNFPLIGCGLANGQWHEVARRIERALGPDVQKTLWLLP